MKRFGGSPEGNPAFYSIYQSSKILSAAFSVGGNKSLAKSGRTGKDFAIRDRIGYRNVMR